VIGGERMDPDVFALLVRRFGQLDAAMGSGNAAVRWRHFLEPDFAVRPTVVNKLPFDVLKLKVVDTNQRF